MLMGFTVGDESTVATLKITDVKQQVALQNGQTQSSHCIGCHTGTPDGDYVAFVDAWPWGAAFAGVKPAKGDDAFTGNPLPTSRAERARTGTTARRRRRSSQYPWNGPMTFSPAHWNDAGDKIAIIATQVQDITMPWGQGSPNWQPGRLAWVDSQFDGDDDDERPDQPHARRGVRLPASTRAIPTGGGVPDLEPRRQLDRLRVGRVPEPGPAERVRNAGRAPLQGRRRSVRGAVREQGGRRRDAGRGRVDDGQRGVLPRVLARRQAARVHACDGGAGDVREPERRDVGRAAPGRCAGEAAGGERSAALQRQVEPGRQQPLAEMVARPR